MLWIRKPFLSPKHNGYDIFLPKKNAKFGFSLKMRLETQPKETWNLGLSR